MLSVMWWCQFIDYFKFETCPSSLLNFGTAYCKENETHNGSTLEKSKNSKIHNSNYWNRRFHGCGRHLGGGANTAKFTVNVWEKS